MMYILVFEFSPFTACAVGKGDEADETIAVAVDGAVVVSAKSCCTSEMFALMEEEMSVMDDLTIATTTFLVTTAIDDPGGD